jgi:hypothetical protein
MNKKHLVMLVVTSLFTAMLAACGAQAQPAAVPDNAVMLSQPTVTSIPATEAVALATQTSLPPTETALPVTETVAPGVPVVISQVHMLDALNGWGWVSNPDGSGALLRTADGGVTWRKASPNQSVSPYGGFFLDAQNAWIPFFDQTANTSGLLRTSDGGETWTSLPTLEAAQNAEYDFINSKDGIAQTFGVGAGNLYLNLYQTSDGGQSWAPILITPPSPEPGLPAGTVHLCNICGDGLYYDSARAIISYGDLANEPMGVVRLAISTDLGQHWQDIKLLFPNQKYMDGLVGPKPMRFFGSEGILPVNIIKYNADGALGYSVLVIYSSQDGGKTWTAAPGLLENNTGQYDSVQIVSAKDAFVRCGPNLCATHDGAQTWQTLPVTLNFDSSLGGSDYVGQFSFISPTSGWAISGESPATTLWRTTDGGVSWVKLATSLAP